MKVLHVIASINRGGAENHLKDLIRFQTDSFNSYIDSVACVFLKGDGYWEKELSFYGCDVFNLNVGFYLSPFAIARLKSLIDTLNPTIVHVHLGPSEIMVSLVTLFGRQFKLVVSKHDHFRYPIHFFSHYLEYFVLSRSDAIIGISHSVIAKLKSRFPSLTTSLYTVHYGINTYPFLNINSNLVNDFKTSLGIDANSLLIGTVSRLVPVKDIKTILYAFSVLQKNIKSDSLYLLIAGDGHEYNMLKDLAEELLISSKVVFTGFLENIEVVMTALDVFVLSSLSEGFGLVVLEAMAANTPVICTNVGALPELIKNNSSGFLFQPKDYNNLAALLMTLLSNNTLRENFALQALKDVKSNFTLTAVDAKISIVYNSLIP